MDFFRQTPSGYDYWYNAIILNDLQYFAVRKCSFYNNNNINIRYRQIMIIAEHLTVLIFFVFGALVGSFLNVAIIRLPAAEKSVVFPPSHCPHCKGKIRWHDNIPLLSFMLLRRRCRHCSSLISWQYPLVEFSMALLAALLYLQFSFTIPFIIYFVFCAALTVIIFIDYHHQIIPDVISLPGIVAGFACSFLNPMLTWYASALGILLGGGSLYVIAGGYYLITKRVGMGGGDIKLLAMIGAFLGWQSLLFVIFSSSLLGSIIGIGAMIKQRAGGKTVIPFGPFLAIGAMLYLFFKETIEPFSVIFF